MDDIKLTPEEEFEFYTKRQEFLENYFKTELSDLSKGETFIITDKYENDYEYHRYKVTQYKANIEHKCIAFEEDLPEMFNQVMQLEKQMENIFMMNRIRNTLMTL